MVKIVLLLFCTLLPLYAKEFFTQEYIQRYLNDANPYYYSLKTHYYITQQKEQISRSAFDTRLQAVYEEKSYPLSSAHYSEASFVKPLYNGMELGLQYRDAQGVQEYSNIKTGKDGEMAVSLKLPVISILTNRSTNAVNYELSQLQTKVSNAKTGADITLLYKKVSINYFELLYSHELFLLTQELFNKAKKRLLFIEKEVTLGNRASIELLDVKSQVITREQKLLEARNIFLQSKNNFIKYLNLTQKEFDDKYQLPKIQPLKETLFSYQKYRDLAKRQRQEFQKIEYEKKKINEQQKGILLEQYPEFDIKLLGVHDIAYKKDGYKLSANFNFPLERNSYKGKKELFSRKKLRFNALQTILMNDINTDIDNLLNAIKMMQQKSNLSQQEIYLRKQLENAENIKYKEGLSNLVFINQRESRLLESQQKRLQALLKTHIYYLELMYVTGDYTKGLK